MATYDEAVKMAASLLPADRRRLLQALEAQSAGLSLIRLAPHSPGWIQAEQGHAVLAVDAGPSEKEIPAGAAALDGIWADRDADTP
jgi:hypothetical protein